MPTESRTEQLLNAYINGDDINNFVPLSRNEQILKDMILGNEQTSSPQSRIESLYKKLDEKIKQGSGGGDIPTRKDFIEKRGCQYLFYGIELTSINDNLLSYDDTENVTNMSYMFYGCTTLKKAPNMNTSKVTDMRYMFSATNYSWPMKLTEVPLYDASNVTKMYGMFYYCSSLTQVSLSNTGKVTDMGSMFNGCSKLTHISQLDTSSVKYFTQMFSGCKELIEVPILDTSHAVYMSYMFQNCNKLTTIPLLNLNNITSNDAVNELFDNCKALTYLKLLNVRVNLHIGSGTNWGHLIEKDCLIQIISELIEPPSSSVTGGGPKTLVMGTANKEKIADTYVKLLADDGTGKHPFEVCTSTDEGAMTIEAYCNSKNWTLA